MHVIIKEKKLYECDGLIRKRTSTTKIKCKLRNFLFMLEKKNIYACIKA